ncbi:hypothetical protein BS50DRAFT_451390, partial [Corynespora cassiicola Philippines]
IDPLTPGTIIRIAMAAETVLNFTLSIALIFGAEKVIARLYLTDGIPATPATCSIAQWFGVATITATIPMLLAIPNKPGAVELRRLSYHMYTVYEALTIPVVFWQAWVAGEAGSGMNVDKLVWNFGLPMIPFIGFRLYVLLVRPDWMGKYR